MPKAPSNLALNTSHAIWLKEEEHLLESTLDMDLQNFSHSVFIYRNIFNQDFKWIKGFRTNTSFSVAASNWFVLPQHESSIGVCFSFYFQHCYFTKPHRIVPDLHYYDLNESLNPLCNFALFAENMIFWVAGKQEKKKNIFNP